MTMRPKKKRKIGDLIWLGCFALVALVMFYGLICYPYAPIRLHNDGHYRDKTGHEFSEAQFNTFTIWEHWHWGTFVMLAAATVPLAVSHHKRRGK